MMTTRSSYRQRGSVFVVTLALLAGLLAILAGVAATQRANIKAEMNRVQRQRARAAAMNGIQRAIATLALVGESQNGTGTGSSNSSSTTPASSTSASGAVTLQDDWATLGQNGDERFIVGNETFRLQIVDGCSLVNINTATEAQLDLLPLQPDEVAALLDFRSTSTTPSANGAKDEYYNNLADPYNTKLGNFDTVDELLQVKGFTAQMLYQPRTDVQTSNPPPVDANGNQVALADIFTAVSYAPMLNAQGTTLLNVNSANNSGQIRNLGLSQGVVDRIAPQGNGPRTTFSTLGDLCAIATNTNDLQIILDNLTIDSATRKLGKININTASQSVLETIPGISQDIASAIVAQQSQGFTSLGQVATVSGMTSSVLAQAADFLTASSQTFIVRVIGTAGDTNVALQALVDVQNGQPKVLMIQEPPYNNVLDRWNWQSTTTTDTTLKEAQ